MGNKNCELSEEDVRRITEAFMACEDTEYSKLFPRETFGYWKIRVRRPLRLRVDLSPVALERFRLLCKAVKDEPLPGLLSRVAENIGPGPYLDFNEFALRLEAAAEESGIKLTAKRLDLVRSGLTAQDDAAAPLIRKESKPKKDADPAREALYGRYVMDKDGRAIAVEYEPDPAFKDSEQIPLLEDGGVDAFFRREVLPHLRDAWIDESATRIGYEISFARYFYKPEQPRTLEEIKADLYKLEDESEGLLARIVGAR
jgi:type I restriction enzyme M protein